MFCAIKTTSATTMRVADPPTNADPARVRGTCPTALAASAGDTAAEGHSIVDAMPNSSGARLRATTPLLTGTVTSTSHAWDRHPGMVQNRRDLGVDRLEST